MQKFTEQETFPRRYGSVGNLLTFPATLFIASSLILLATAIALIAICCEK